MRRLRIYLDTSVFGGALDEEFREASMSLFDRIARNEIIVLLSDETERELTKAPDNVKKVRQEISSAAVERIGVTDEVLALAQAYIDKGVLGKTWLSDAVHVAAATTASADLIVSWNFKHIVNYRRIQLFNAENMRQGYPQVDIRSPLELQDEGQDQEL